MSEITAAITARQTQIAQLQSDIETLQRAASIMGGGVNTPAKAVRQKVRSQPKATPQLKPSGCGSCSSVTDQLQRSSFVAKSLSSSDASRNQVS